MWVDRKDDEQMKRQKGFEEHGRLHGRGRQQPRHQALMGGNIWWVVEPFFPEGRAKVN